MLVHRVYYIIFLGINQRFLKGYISFDKDRMPIYRIDYGRHWGELSLHVHHYINGDIDGVPTKLKSGDELYEKHKKLFKGVKL